MKFGKNTLRLAFTLGLLMGCSSSSPGGAGGASGLGGTSGGGGESGAAGGGGAGGATTSDPAEALAGTWIFQAGSLQPMCNVAVATLDLTGDLLTITRLDATHVNVTSTGGIACNASFTVTGAKATVEAGQTCSATIMGNRVTVDVTGWTVELSGSTLSTALTGTITSPVTCTPMGTGTLGRAG
ncbi:MAG TPA: hypothetical protein VGP07_17540 [Polyangia bacterium]